MGLSPLLPQLAPQLTAPQWKSLPPSLSLTNTESPMTTQRLTSRRLRPRTHTETSLDLSPLLFPLAESRPPRTLRITRTDSSLRLPMKVPQSTPQSPPVDTVTPPLPTSQAESKLPKICRYC